MRDIPGYKGLYAITSCGKVWSYMMNDFMKSWDNGHGYQYIWLTNMYGTRKQWRINQLMGITWLEKPEGATVVAHKDDCRSHNWVSNLFWTTQKENLDTDHFREASKHKQFTPILCVETGEVFPSQAAAARWVGIHKYGINNVLMGKQKTAGGYHWQRVVEDSEKIS